MKKHQFKIAVLSLSALAFVSCKKDEKPAVTGDVMTFTATIDNGGAKTVIDGVNVKWTENDSIFINGEVFHSELEGEGETAVFTGPALEETTYTAYFGVKKDGNTYQLSATQTYNSANNLSGINPMYAYSETTDLQFHNICGLLRLDVKGEGTVKEIKVSKEDVALCGPFIIENNRAVVPLTPSNDSVVTLNCGDGVELDTDDATTFYIALPQGNYKDLNVKLTGGKDWNTTLSVAIYAGKIRTKELTGVDVVDPVPEGAISGKFTINSSDDMVYFSKGNLQYQASSNTWQFADEQYSYIGSANSSVSATNTGWIDLFGWGTSGYDQTSVDATYVHYQPWSTDESTTGHDATYNKYGYGPALNLSPNYLTGKSDWGYNKISNGGNTENFGWRTLKKDEWNYLLTVRCVNGGTNYGYTCNWVTINSVNGLIIFPDDYTGPTSGFTSIPEGCVFLPAAGYRSGTSLKEVDSNGHYWSSTPSSTKNANNMCSSTSGVSMNPDLRCNGYSVRLALPVDD